MLPVYKAISFKGILEKGGRTKPWVVFVQAGTEVQPFVIKLFNTDEIENRDSVGNEVFGNILAKEFDLPVSRAALIEFEDDFIATLPNHRFVEIIESKDQRIKFGTLLLDDVVKFDTSVLNASQARNILAIDSLFAFDNLIRNNDRNTDARNLLLKKDEAFLIDHELAFDIDSNTFSELKNLNWNPHFYKNHIFLHYLKESWAKNKLEYFSEFEEYLRLLNISILDPYFQQLKDHGFPTRKHEIIKDYLSNMKHNFSNFVKLMREIIS